MKRRMLEWVHIIEARSTALDHVVTALPSWRSFPGGSKSCNNSPKRSVLFTFATSELANTPILGPCQQRGSVPLWIEGCFGNSSESLSLPEDWQVKFIRLRTPNSCVWGPHGPVFPLAVCVNHLTECNPSAHMRPCPQGQLHPSCKMAFCSKKQYNMIIWTVVLWVVGGRKEKSLEVAELASSKPNLGCQKKVSHFESGTWHSVSTRSLNLKIHVPPHRQPNCFLLSVA